MEKRRSVVSRSTATFLVVLVFFSILIMLQSSFSVTSESPYSISKQTPGRGMCCFFNFSVIIAYFHQSRCTSFAFFFVNLKLIDTVVGKILKVSCHVFMCLMMNAEFQSPFSNLLWTNQSNFFSQKDLFSLC